MSNSESGPTPPAEAWEQVALLTKWPEQRIYEVIRPVVLFGRSRAVRARETGTPRSSLYRQVAAFDERGMASLFAPATPSAPPKHRQLPPEIRQAILALKAEHPAFRPREITGICAIRFGRSLSHHTVQRILAEEPAPPAQARRFPPYQRIVDPTERRLAIVRLHAEGWNAQSIAQYLGTSRQTVHAVLKRWIDEGVLGLDDKSHARKDGVRRVDLAAIAAVRALQENPALGEWRVHAALKQLGIFLSPRTCGRLLARNRQLYGLARPTPVPKEPKPMPFAAQRRHQYWSVDIRYIDNDHRTERAYSITILENYSRAILASALSPRQDLTAFLIVLYAAIRQHGAPEALVSDGGSVFRANQVLRIDDALGIRKDRIARKQPWPGALWAHTSRRCSTSSGGWPTGISRGPRPGERWRTSMPAGWATTTSKTTGHTGSGPTDGAARRRCSAGSPAGHMHPTSCTASSTAPASGGGWIGSDIYVSGTGACMVSRAWPASRSRCGSTSRP